MTLAWKQKSELPEFSDPTTILIAYPCLGDDGEPMLAAEIFIAHGPGPRGRGENTGAAPWMDEWYWVRESEALEGLTARRGAS